MDVYLEHMPGDIVWTYNPIIAVNDSTRRMYENYPEVLKIKVHVVTVNYNNSFCIRKRLRGSIVDEDGIETYSVRLSADRVYYFKESVEKLVPYLEQYHYEVRTEVGTSGQYMCSNNYDYCRSAHNVYLDRMYLRGKLIMEESVLRCKVKSVEVNTNFSINDIISHNKSKMLYKVAELIVSFSGVGVDIKYGALRLLSYKDGTPYKLFPSERESKYSKVE